MTDSPEVRTARAMAVLDGLADLWFAESGFAALALPERFVRVVKQAYAEGLYNARCATLDEMAAVPVEQWKVTVDQDVLLYLVHNQAQYEKDPARRQRDWECWAVGRWIDHNGGGWTWHGMSGQVKYVASLPARPQPT